MSSHKVGMSLVACLLNISEAKNQDIVRRIVKAAIFNSHGQKHPDTSVLNVFSNYDYNRSVITIVSTREQIGKSVLSACVEGFAAIDLSLHDGIHPCLGAIDLVPIYPLSGVTLEQCGEIATGSKFLTQVYRPTFHKLTPGKNPHTISQECNTEAALISRVCSSSLTWRIKVI
ncbi:formiminotransferase N-terminal subdomain-containing protein isoform X3 [Hyperolius riggenbachi]|uniref:formiminotransferase N-terminal subdomain-containing protein isoform X3 n=1 Tax=Hyperolius riggenbachi TaxID=752182 RepID=UPI0035A3C6EC